MRIFFAADHAGFELKKKLIEFVEELKFEAVDLGPENPNPEDDYPVIIEKAALEVSKEPESRAVILGKSGQGEAIVANRFPNVRAVVYYGPASAKASSGEGQLDIIRLSREHNNSNILSVGAAFVTEEEAKEAVKLWLATSFSGESRHIRRLKEIDELEESLYKTNG